MNGEKQPIVVGKACKRKLTARTIMTENSPMVALWALTGILLFNISWIYVVLFAIYVPISVLWFMRFICAYCSNFDTGCCPSGYGNATAKLFLFRDETKFKQVFNRNISIVFPYWFLPLIAGGYLIYNAYPDVPSWLLLVFILAIVDGFVFLPLVSNLVGCKDCNMRDTCPWAKEGGKPKKHVF